MNWLFDPQIWASLLALTALEIVLGIDNIVFISVAADELAPKQRRRARHIGLLLAFVMRLLMLVGIVWMAGLTRPIFEIMSTPVSWKDLILIVGGMFLLTKGTREIHNVVEGAGEEGEGVVRASFVRVVIQIMLLDTVFSIDSVITAVGMTPHLPVMVVAISIAMAVMVFAADAVGTFIERYPTTKILALSFLLLVGVVLVADGLHFHIPRGYLYFGIGFSSFVQTLNIVAARRRVARRARRAARREG